MIEPDVERRAAAWMRVANEIQDMAARGVEVTVSSALLLELLSRTAAGQVACRAALRYDAAIETCADDPERMASFCTAEGDDLDALYLDWIGKSRQVVATAEQLDAPPAKDGA